MKSPRIIAALLVLLLLLLTASCDTAPPAVTEAPETESSFTDSPYQVMQAYVSDLSDSYAIGQTTSGFKTEKDFRFPAYKPSYNDPSAPQAKTFKHGNSNRNVSYKRSRDYRYLDCTYDVYLGTTGYTYEFERNTQKLGFFSSEDQIDRTGSIFSSNEEVIPVAKEHIASFIDEDVSHYTYEITVRNYGYSTYDIVWTLFSDDIIVSRIRTCVCESGALSSITLRDYRENASAIVIPEGTNAKCVAAIKARIEENRTTRAAENNPVTYERYEINTGFLYYDEDNRPYVLYQVDFHYENALERADFIVYIE